MLSPPSIVLFIDMVPDEFRHDFEEVSLGEEFQDADSLREQVSILCYHLRKIRDPKVTYEAIGDFLGITRGGAAYHESQYLNPPRKNGRPSMLTDDEITLITIFLNERFNEGEAPTFQMIDDFISTEFGKDIVLDTLRHIINSMEGFKTTDAIPMDKDRFGCDNEEIMNYYNDLKTYISGVPAAFIINVDESGFQPFKDAKKMRVVVPIDHHEEVFYGADQSVARNYLIAGIYGDGTYNRPLIVLDRKTI